MQIHRSQTPSTIVHNGLSWNHHLRRIPFLLATKGRQSEAYCLTIRSRILTVRRRILTIRSLWSDNQKENSDNQKEKADYQKPMFWQSEEEFWQLEGEGWLSEAYCLKIRRRILKADYQKAYGQTIRRRILTLRRRRLTIRSLWSDN